MWHVDSGNIDQGVRFFFSIKMYVSSCRGIQENTWKTDPRINTQINYIN